MNSLPDYPDRSRPETPQPSPDALTFPIEASPRSRLNSLRRTSALSPPSQTFLRPIQRHVPSTRLPSVHNGDVQETDALGILGTREPEWDFLKRSLQDPHPLLANPVVQGSRPGSAPISPMYHAETVAIGSGLTAHRYRSHRYDRIPSPHSSVHGSVYDALPGDEDVAASTATLPTQSSHLRITYYSPSTGPIHATSLPSLQQKPALPTDHFDTLAELLQSAYGSQQGCFWLDITAPTTAELHLLARTFRIHPLTVEDVLTEDTRETCETFRGYHFVCYRTWEYVEDTIHGVGVYLILLSHGVISLHHSPLIHVRNVLRRISNQVDPVGTITPDWISYAIVDDITDAFQPLVHSVQLEVDAVDELVLILNVSEQQDMLRRIGAVRRRVMAVLRLLSPKADVVRTLVKRTESPTLHTPPRNDILVYLADIQDHLLTLIQSVTHSDTILSRAHSNYLAQISIELTQSSNRTNDVMARLTVLASIMVPMNVVTGLWGMNVEVPGQGAEGLWWFAMITGALAVLGVLLFWLMRDVM